jgi:hypothetical protein
MTTNTNPKAIRLLLNSAGLDTALLDIAPSSHGVLITTLTETPADAKLITDVHVVLHLNGLEATRRTPYVIKAHSPREKGRKPRR